ncbi:aminoglycoside phosphotransferase family protein [Ornithinimicrobium pratense]|uniref:Kinase n=1 Tax=Ornithinimicrobium pratense TaxID=2593973 RepID=A0A5J6V4M1_9MICO|nr:aminoglycoside phosphotransferase family protein [Ornithinimicrobium pratense]QFG68930.1 kinase [Ornithinimicrobium pratense]
MAWSLTPADLPAQLVRDLTGRPVDAEQDVAPSTGRGSRVTRAARVDGDTWLAQLPRTVADAMDRWQLTPDPATPLRSGYTAVVIPVWRPRGDAGVLKVGWPHPEADHEHLALRAWAGAGAVQLLAADPASATLLLERLEADRDLTSGSVLGTTETLGHLARLLDRPAPPWAPRLSVHLAGLVAQLDRFAADPGSARAFPRRMVQQATSIARDLLSEGGGSAAGEGPHPLDARLVHTDLHQGNALWRPDPGEWVAIDPKAMAADPHWALAPALWDRWEDVLAAHDARAHLQLRIGLLCDAAGLDEDRARAMTILRLVHSAVHAARTGGPDAAEWADKAVTIVKAAQPG